eukprot:gene7715-15787_t
MSRIVIFWGVVSGCLLNVQTYPLLNKISFKNFGSTTSFLRSEICRLAAVAPPAQDEIRTFSSYVIYKGKAALSIKPIPPTFTSRSPNSRSVARTGGILLEFAPVSGPREYDWSKKGTFMIDVSECGEIIALDISTKGTLEFLHDPNMGSPQAGQITKKLKFLPTQDGKGFFASLQVTDKSSTGPNSYSLPISLGEFAVLRNIISFCLPRFLAFDCGWGSSMGSSDFGPVPLPPPAYKTIEDN